MNSRNKRLIVFATLLFILSGFILAKMFKIVEARIDKETNLLLIQSQKENDINKKFVIFQEVAFLKPSEASYLRAGVAALEVRQDEIAKAYLSKIKSANGYYLLGNAYFSLGNFADAERSYESAKKLDSKNSDYWLSLAKSLLKENKVNDAETVLNEGSERFESQEMKKLLSILRFTQSKQYDKSNLSDLYSEDKATLINNVYRGLKDQGYPQAAEDFLSLMADQDRLNRDGYLLLAEVKLNNGSYPAEYDLLLKAKEMDAYYPQTYKQLVSVCEKLGKQTEKIQYQTFLNNISW